MNEWINKYLMWLVRGENKCSDKACLEIKKEFIKD